MANRFDFELRADDQVSAALKNIDDQVRDLLPQLEKTRDGLALGGQETKDGLTDFNKMFDQLGRFAKDNVQLIGDMVPPLRNVTGQVGKFGGLIGRFGMAGSAAYLAGKGIAKMGGDLSDAADDAYSLQIAAENAGMGVQEFTRLSGAMQILGSDSTSARGSVEALYKTFNDALQGRNNSALAIMNQVHAGIVRNADGTANVLGTMQQLAAVFPKLSPQNQKTVADALGLNADGLQLLREGARLKELLTKSDTLGLTVDPALNQKLVAMNRALTENSAAWDGLKNRVARGFQKALLSDGSVQNVTEGWGDILEHGPDNIAVMHALDFNKTKQANEMREGYKHPEFMNSLSTYEKVMLDFGLMTDGYDKKYQSYSRVNGAANQLQEDVQHALNPDASTPGIPASGTQNRYALSLLNNNPWNLRYAGQHGATPGEKNFAHFGSGDQGVAAADRQLMLYYSGESKNVDHPLRTLSEIINKASPMSDGNDTPSMIANASKELGIDPNAQLNLTDPRERARVLTALFNQEGNNPYTTDRIQSIIQPTAGGQPSILSPNRAPVLPVPGQAAGPSVEDITKAFTEAMKQNGMKVEVTLIDSKTGQRQSATGSGAKVTTAMPFP